MLLDTQVARRFSTSSLTFRIVTLGLLNIVLLLGLVWSLIAAGQRTQASFSWVSHTYQVIETIDDTVASLVKAESGQRGFLLTHNSEFVARFAISLDDSRRNTFALQQLVRDNPLQTERATGLQQAVDNRIAVLNQALALGRAGRFAEANGFVANGRGRELMQLVERQAATMIAEERRLLATRESDAAHQAAWNRQLVIYGGPAIVVFALVSIILLVSSIRRPIGQMLSSMEAFGSGERSTRMTPAMGSAEFNRLASAYNQLADQLELSLRQQILSDEALVAVNAELRQRSEDLAQRGAAIALLGGMAHRMQAARSDEELAAIVECFMPQILPQRGALYAHNNSRNLLVRLAIWGESYGAQLTFQPEQCWGLRRGQGHGILGEGKDIVCAHVGTAPGPYHCEPMLAGGEVIGLLYLEGQIDLESQFKLGLLSENISSALTNQRLQRGLRELSIRDPLTGLYNRRFMEEALATEIARAGRDGAPLSLVMCDIDHFKRFNDEFGHDAGDTLLRGVATELIKQFRDGDVVCRFGGEEFTIIAPGALAEALRARVESARLAIAAMAISHGGRVLGSVSMSFGIASLAAWMGGNAAELIQNADAALYTAKRNGRNQSAIAKKLAA